MNKITPELIAEVKANGASDEEIMVLESQLEDENNLEGKEVDVASEDANVTSESVASKSMELELEDGSLELPQVTMKDVDVPERQAINRFKKKFGGLGFEFDQAGYGTDRVIIYAPPEFEGQPKEDREKLEIQTDLDLFGFSTYSDRLWGASSEQTAKDINAFVKEHAQGSPVNPEAYAVAWNVADTYEVKGKDGKSKKIKDLSSEELVEHMKSAYQATLHSQKLPGVKEVFNEINTELENFTRTTVSDLKSKYDLTDSKQVELANKELKELITKKQDELFDQNQELKNIQEGVFKAVESRFGSVLDDKLRKEAEDMHLPSWVTGFDSDYIRQGYVTAAIKFPKALKEVNILHQGIALKEIGDELNDLNNKIEQGASLDEKYIKRGMPGKEGLPTVLYEGTIGDRIKDLESKKFDKNKNIAFKLTEQKEYQKKLEDVRVPTIFGKDISDPDLTIDEWQGMLGDQTVQMISAVLTMGGSTYIQEGGGAALDIIEIEAAKKAYPKLDVEEALKAFRSLPAKDTFTDDNVKQKGRASLMADILDKGEANLTPAVVVGATNAGLDLVSNWFVIGKATKFAPKSLGRDLLRGKVGKFLSEGYKTVGKDLGKASLMEFVTETAQEGTSITGVGVSTGYYGNKDANIKRLAEAGGQALLSTGPLVGAGKVATTTAKELRARTGVAWGADIKATRDAINQIKKEYTQYQKDGTITVDQLDEVYAELEAQEDFVNNTKYKNLSNKEKIKVIDNLVEISNQKKDLDKLQEENKKIEKEEGVSEGLNPSTVQNDIKSEIVKNKIKELQNNNLKELWKHDYKESGISFAEWINNQTEGFFADKVVMTFDKVEDARNFIEGNNLEQEAGKNPLEVALNLQMLYNGDVNGANLGDIAIIINDNVDKNINKLYGDWSSSNVVHHEAFHFILDAIPVSELQKTRNQVLSELKKSTDPKIKAALELHKEKMNLYTGDKRTRTYNEEWFTTLSDAMKGIKNSDINLENGVALDGVGKIFGGLFQGITKKGFDFTKFDAQNALEFIKKYNDFNGKSPGLVLPGVKGKVDVQPLKKKGVAFKMSKTASDKVQKIFEEKGVAGAMEIIEEFKPITSKIAERRRGAPNFDKELLMSEIEIGERGIFDLIRAYDPTKGVPLAAWINQNLPNRAIEASRRVLGEEFVEDITEKVDIAAEEVTPKVETKPKKRKTILSDRLGVKNKVDDAIKARLPELNVESLTFKTLKDQTPEITGELFGISPKKLISGANITKKELQSAQMFIAKNADLLIAMLPEGATAGGTATGIPKTLLNEFYIKGERAKMAKTGTKAGLAVQTKKPSISRKEFLEVFGIIDGKPIRTDRNTSARVLAIANLLGKMMTNQAVREQLLEQGKPLEVVKRISDGKSAVMFSKGIANLSIEKQIFFFENIVEVAGNMNPALVDLLEWKNVKDILEETYGEKLTSSELAAIAKDFVKLISRFQPTVSANKAAPRIEWTEYVITSFAEADNSIIKMLYLFINGKKPTAASLYDIKQNIERGRRKLIEFGNYLIDKGYSVQEVANIMAMLKPMYAGNSKVGRGMFYTDKKGFVRPVKLAKGKKFGSPRNQIFENVLMFEKWGVMQIKGFKDKNGKPTKAAKEAWSKAEKLKAQKSKAAIKDKDYKGRLAEAKKARQVIDLMMTFLSEKGNDLDMAMFMISNLSNMNAPLRRAANLRYIADEVLEMDIDKVGSLAEYEHMIPANIMALKILDAYKNEGGIKNLDEFYDGYHVAIIPKTMDDVLKKSGLQSNMLPGHDLYSDPSWKRYYNYLTNGVKGIVPIRDISNNKLIGVKFSKNINGHEKLNNAIQKARTTKFSKSNQGITVLDFDDTLATTKSGVRARIPNTDGTPKPRRKAILLAGGAGSGKSNVVKQLGLVESGFKIVNQDIALEWLKKNAGLPTDMRDLTKKQRSELGKLGWEARKIAKRKYGKFKGQGDGVVVDGTGASLKTIQKQKEELEAAGYDVQMIYVETSLPVALERNRARKERSLSDNIVKRNHEAVQNNKAAFKEMFGNGFTEVNTDNLKQGDPIPSSVVDKINEFVTGYEKRRLDAEEFARDGADLLAQGAEFDFSEFNIVVEGQTAPLFQKALKLQEKFGTKDMYVLTARPAESAPHIHAFLKANGLNIPLENITGLANSTSEAKALWMADKVAEGYNDFYFADDALQNVQAVQNMLDQLDVKSKVQQAKVKFSKSMDKNFNDILESISGIESKKRFSDIKARKRGVSKGKFRFFIPPSHEDFVGLLYNFMGKGKEGNAHRDFFEQALIRPLNRAYRELNAAKQSIANDYKSLNKKYPNVKKKLTKKTPDGDFTYQDAIRVYLWSKHGYSIPGLSKTDQQNLIDLVANDPELQVYAETLNIISKQEKYVNPTKGWEAGDLRTDLEAATGRVGREQFFTEFFENTDIIFSQENLNKIEAIYGSGMVSAIKDILYRTKTGRNRPSGQNKLVNQFLNYLNGSVAATMFFNIRSMVLQQMSMVNFINFADNNMLAAAKAFANQPQYWADWATIFNSDFMKERRGGIKTDVNGAELAASVKEAVNPAQAVIKKLLQLGFLPTQIGDNIAIATGGATYYRNRIKTYLKQGLSQKEAESKAWTDFQVLAEATQQSARPDMVSQQQASPLGKVILAFQNVTSQFNRLGKKAFLDLYNRRISPEYKNTSNPQLQSDMSNVSRILYYFAIQNLIFYSLQSALFMAMFDDNEDDEKWLKKRERVINGSIDSVLRGTGVWGAVVATLKNMAIRWHEQREKGYNADESAVLMEMLNVSPPLGIKARKIVSAEKTLNYNKKVIDEMETFNLDNPMWSAYTSYIEATTNVPVNRIYNKTVNVRDALDAKHSALERALMFSGYSKWNLGIPSEEIEKIKKKQKFGIKKFQKKREELKEVIKEEKKQEKEGKKTTFSCSAIKTNGERCNNSVEKAGARCTVHTKVEQRKDGKETVCTATRTNGKPCNMKTTAKSGLCVYHD